MSKDYSELSDFDKYAGHRCNYCHASYQDILDRLTDGCSICHGRLMLTSFDAINKLLASNIKENKLVMANARRLIKAKKSTSNGRLFSELYSTGQGTAREWCRKLGLDPDSNETSYTLMMKDSENDNS